MNRSIVGRLGRRRYVVPLDRTNGRGRGTSTLPPGTGIRNVGDLRIESLPKSGSCRPSTSPSKTGLKVLAFIQRRIWRNCLSRLAQRKRPIRALNYFARILEATHYA